MTNGNDAIPSGDTVESGADDAVDPGLIPPDPIEDVVEPEWANDALSAEVLLNEDDPHHSVMELLVGDLDGRLGAVHLSLGPIEVRALLHNLDHVQVAQEVAEWVAEGRDLNEFPVDEQSQSPASHDATRGEESDPEGDDHQQAEPGTGRRRLERYTDPLSVKTWLEQDYRLGPFKVQWLLIGVAIMAGIVMALAGVLL